MQKKNLGLLALAAVAAQVAQFSQAQINELESKGEYVIDVDGQNLTIELVDVEVISEDIP
jgi:isoleucyl-tRNA synthetase